MKRIFRSLVASPKQKIFTDSGIELDFSYILHDLAVCSGPEVNSPWLRYPLNELKQYLEGTNKDWNLWNFREDYRGYSANDVEGKVSFVPFPDHQPPTLEVLHRIVLEIHKFLNQAGDSQNGSGIENPVNPGRGKLAVLHCKAGKGRSGMVCCAYLMYSKGLNSDEAMELYTTKRMQKFAGSGVSILSQIRYLRYWEQVLKNEEIFRKLNTSTRPTYIIKRITLFGVPKAFKKLTLTISQYKKKDSGLEIEAKLNAILEDFLVIDMDTFTIEPANLEVKEDVQLLLFGCNYLWFNCGLDSGEFTWDEFDGWKGIGWRGVRFLSHLKVEYERVT